MATTVTYKGNTLTTANNQTRVLETAGTWLEDDITLVDVTPKKYTATIIARSYTSGFVRYIGSNGTAYETVGSTFTFNDGEDLYVVAADSHGYAGTIIIDGATVASGGQNSVHYTYSLPSNDINISFSGGTTTIESVTSTISLQAKTNIDPTTSSQTITADNGYDGLSSVQINAMPSGSATTPATTITANPSISVSNSGLITATTSASQSVTPSVNAGYISSGTAGTVTVSGSNTSQLTTMAAQSVTPTTSSQTVATSGKYMTGDVTVGAIPSNYIVPSGSLSITTNNTYDVTQYASAVVNVAATLPSSGYTLENIAPTQTVTPSEPVLNAYSGPITTYTEPLETGNPYLVTIDGQYEYVLWCYEGWANEFLLGDNQVVDSLAVSRLEAPFCIDSSPSNNVFELIARTTDSYTVKIDKITFIDETATLSSKTITANGTYNASSDSLDGYSAVTVSIPYSTITVSSSSPSGGSNGDVWIKTS